MKYPSRLLGILSEKLAYNFTENRAENDTQIASLVHDMHLKMNAQDYLEKLKLIAVALDRVQGNFCTFSEIWLNLLSKFRENLTETDLSCCEKRFAMTMTPAHFLANILDHCFRGFKLDSNQHETAMEYAAASYPDAMTHIINYEAEAFPFKTFVYDRISKKC